MVLAARQAFESTLCEATSGGGSFSTADDGYMTARLRGLHVSSHGFASIFRDFTEHSSTDRWSQDHPDAAARGKPKDGAILIDFSGYLVCCAVKLLGLSPPRKWHNVGTKH